LSDRTRNRHQRASDAGRGVREKLTVDGQQPTVKSQEPKLKNPPFIPLLQRGKEGDFNHRGSSLHPSPESLPQPSNLFWMAYMVISAFVVNCIFSMMCRR
jgi:hypothetical protein